MQICGVAEPFFGAHVRGRLFLAPQSVNAQVFAPDIHPGLVPIELIQLIVARFVVHRSVINREDSQEIFRVFGGHND